MSFKEKILELVDPFVRLPVVGIDVSELTLKYLKLRSNGKLTFDFFGEIDLPEGLIVNGEIKQEDDLVKALGMWLVKDGKKVRSSYVAVSLPEEKSFLRVIQLPKVKIEEVGNAIRWEIEGNIPLPPEEIAFGYEVVEPLEDHLDHFDVVITAFPRSVVESYVRVFKRVGLQPVVMELESQAIVRAVVSSLREKPTKIIVDMGRMRTSLIVISGGAIIFTTTFPLGGAVLEENIMKNLKVSKDKAITLKKEFGLNKQELDGKLFNALVPAMAVLADELRKAVEYYQNHTRHIHGGSPMVDKILLSGGESNLYGLATYLSSATKIPVELADPLVNLKDRLNPAIPSLAKNQSLAFTTAIGLALRGVKN